LYWLSATPRLADLRNQSAARLVEILGNAVAFFVQRAEPEQRGREPAAGGTFIPDGRLLEILRHAAAFGETGRHLVGGGRLARCGGGEQHLAAERRRELVGLCGYRGRRRRRR
jgi:hypothetical protein